MTGDMKKKICYDSISDGDGDGDNWIVMIVKYNNKYQE